MPLPPNLASQATSEKPKSAGALRPVSAASWAQAPHDSRATHAPPASVNQALPEHRSSQRRKASEGLSPSAKRQRGQVPSSSSHAFITPIGKLTRNLTPNWAGASSQGINGNTAYWHFQVLRPHMLGAEDRGHGKRGVFPLSAPLKGLREQSVDSLVRLHKSYQLRGITLHLAVVVIDVCLARLKSGSRQLDKMVRHPRLLAATALSLASKFEDEAVPEFTSLAMSANGEFGAEDIHAAELMVLDLLNYRLHFPLAPHHLHWLLEAVGASSDHRAVAEYLCEAGLQSLEFPKWKPLEHAAGATVLAAMMIGIPEWHPDLEACCGVVDNDAKRASIMQALCGLCRILYSFGPGFAIYDKHSSSGMSARIDEIVVEVTGKKKATKKAQEPTCVGGEQTPEASAQAQTQKAEKGEKSEHI